MQIIELDCWLGFKVRTYNKTIKTKRNGITIYSMFSLISYEGEEPLTLWWVCT